MRIALPSIVPIALLRRLAVGCAVGLSAARAAAQGDFASIHPVAFGPWSADNGTEGVKTVLRQRGYVYALGGSTGLR